MRPKPPSRPGFELPVMLEAISEEEKAGRPRAPTVVEVNLPVGELYKLAGRFQPPTPKKRKKKAAKAKPAE